MTEFRPCVVIPTYDNPLTVRAVVIAARALLPVILVDDGSGPDARQVIDELDSAGLAKVQRHPVNRGKGAAVRTGLEAARDCGYTHALQIDADGQHDEADIPKFLEIAHQSPGAAVLGAPIFDKTVPPGRLAGRQVSKFWVNCETASRRISDPLCGFRVYPVPAVLAASPHGNRMNFDPEIAVRLAWSGVPIINVPTRVRYLSAAEGGVSHFRMFRDNVLISLTHARLVLEAIWRVITLRGLGGR